MADDTNLFDFAWGKLIGGALLVWVAYWMHGVFTELDARAAAHARAGPTGRRRAAIV